MGTHLFGSPYILSKENSRRVTFFTEWLDSSSTQWLETIVRVIFTKSLNIWLTNQVTFHTRKLAFLLQSRIIDVRTNFYFDCVSLWCYARFLGSGRGATSSSFRGAEFSWNFIRWRHRFYSTVVQRFHKRSHILIIMYFYPQTRSP